MIEACNSLHLLIICFCTGVYDVFGSPSNESDIDDDVSGDRRIENWLNERWWHRRKEEILEKTCTVERGSMVMMTAFLLPLSRYQRWDRCNEKDGWRAGGDNEKQQSIRRQLAIANATPIDEAMLFYADSSDSLRKHTRLYISNHSIIQLGKAATSDHDQTLLFASYYNIIVPSKQECRVKETWRYPCTSLKNRTWQVAHSSTKQLFDERSSDHGRIVRSPGETLLEIRVAYLLEAMVETISFVLRIVSNKHHIFDHR
jgi:hypothetical protein